MSDTLCTVRVCRCSAALHYSMESRAETAAYLRELADRIEAGQIHHVSVSSHPKGDPQPKKPSPVINACECGSKSCTHRPGDWQ